MILFGSQVSAVELLILFGVSLIFGYYLYYLHGFTYWKKKGVPTAKPSFPFGDLKSSALGKQSVYTRLEDLYNQFKSKGCKHGGIYFFNGPIYFPIDPELIKRILVTDFEYFVDRGMYGNLQELPLSGHIFSMEGEEWKNIRAKMSPSFTSGKMKSIYNIVVRNCENLLAVIEPLAEKRQVVDMKEVLMRFTADVIGSTSFGIDCNSLNYPNNEFSQMVSRISNHSGWKLLRVALEEGLQNPGNIEKIAYNDKVVEDFFTNLVKQTINYRDKNNIVRKDFLHMLMQLRASGMSINEIVSQSYLFFIAGFKTSALTMCYCIHELAHNQELQDKIRDEIHKNLGRDVGQYGYEDLIALPTLDKTLKETMRKYPPLPMLNRICVKQYQVPGTDVVIEKGTPVVISLLGLQRDPEFYPEPLQFDPDRFSNNENNIVPYTYLPFGDGPRNCIGLRFGMVMTKLAVASLLNNFRFLPSSKTRRNLVIDPSTTSILFNVRNGIYTKIIKV